MNFHLNKEILIYINKIAIMIKESQHNILVIVNTHIVFGKFYLEKIIHVKNKKLIRKQKSSKTEKNPFYYSGKLVGLLYLNKHYTTVRKSIKGAHYSVLGCEFRRKSTGRCPIVLSKINLTLLRSRVIQFCRGLGNDTISMANLLTNLKSLNAVFALS